MITENLMGAGQFTINLDAMPLEVRDQLVMFATIAVTPARISVAELTTDAEILAAAEWAGVLISVPRGDDNAIGGYGMAFWLGDDTRGVPYDSKITFAGNTLSSVLTSLLPPQLTLGTVTNPASSFVGGVPAHALPRKAIDYVSETLGTEWRVNPDASLDAGTASALWPGVAAVVVRDVARFDMDYDAVSLASLTVDTDVEDYITEARVVSGNTYETASQATPYLDPQGNALRRVRVEQETGTAADPADRAAALLAESGGSRRQVNLSLRDYKLTGSVRVGATIGVYDPQTGLWDATNPIPYGDGIYPVNLRVMSATWPVKQGMGVYQVLPGSDPVDLSEYVVFEDGDTSIDVGAAPRTPFGGATGAASVVDLQEVAGEVTKLKEVSACRAYKSANASLTSGTWTGVTLNTEDYDDGLGLHSTSSNADRFTAPVAGYLDLSLNVEFAANAAGERQIRASLNGAAGDANAVIDLLSDPAPTNATRLNGSVTGLKMAAGDYVTLGARQTSGGALNVVGGQYTTFATATFRPS